MNQAIVIVAKYFVFIPLIILLIEFLRLKISKRKELVILLIVGGILTIILVKLATTFHQDPRPFIRDGVKPLLSSSTDNGFPSDHTAFSALIGFVLLKFSVIFGILVLVLTVLLGWSRVYAGVHHAQDVIGGIVLAGVAVGVSIIGINLIGKKN